VVLAYFVSDEATSVSVITYDGVQTTSRIAITQNELAEQVRAFREEIESPPMGEQAAVAYLSALEKGRDLYELLIAPVEEYLEGAEHLVIIPSDVLFYVPFGAMYICSGCEKRDLYGGEFLIERYPISYASSLCSLELSLQKGSREEYRSILAVGNPLGDLYCSEEEATNIASLFPDRTALIGTGATEETIKGLLRERRYDVVHFATHCLSLDGQAPFSTGIRLHPGENEDGVFRIDELLGLNASIDLLTFSTGLGIEPPIESTAGQNGPVSSTGKAFRGLTDALLASGVASTVIPLGTINDCSTKYLMEVMYQELMQGMAKDEALREAQLSLLRDPYYSHPYFWACFVLYGDWSGTDSTRPPDTGKLDYALYQALQEWKTGEHAPDETPPLVSVVVTLSRPAIQEDLETLRALSDEIEIQGAFGNFVQLCLPLTLLDVVCALPEVRSVATPAGTISN
jgi:CHAT domain-containing protein